MPPSQPHKEIDSLLFRLHSGCRFVDLDGIAAAPTARRRRGGSAGDAAAGRDVANLLRNSSPPDEVHAQLGRALAQSYLRSLGYIASSEGEEAWRAAEERGERILRALCRGDDATDADGDGRSTPRHAGGANYASTACSFFDQLVLYFTKDGEGDGDAKSFITSQWQKWCTRCEELALPQEGLLSERSGVGGVCVLNTCLKGYVRICHLGHHQHSKYDGGTTNDGCARVYECLAHHSSRKYLIRTCVSHAIDGLMLPKNAVAAGGLVEGLSPLFHSCVLSARKWTGQQTFHHEERRLMLQEVSRGCSLLLLRARVEGGTIIGEVSEMCRYLTSSLASYLQQSIHAAFSKATTVGSQDDVFELGQVWLRDICDLTTTLASRKDADATTRAVVGSIETIATTILPQFTPSASFDMAPIYSSLASCVRLLPQHELVPVANEIVAMRLGSLALTLHDDADVNIMCELMLAIFGCLDGHIVKRGDALIGGILTALGCVFRCRLPCCHSATQMIKLGDAMLSHEHVDEDESNAASEGAHLMDIIIKCSMGGEALGSLMGIISASISDTGPPTNLISAWQRRPLSMPDQCSGLLLGVSLLHMSVSPTQGTLETGQALSFLRSFLECYPRMSSRAVPVLIDMARTCLGPQSDAAQTALLSPLEFLASPCIVSDPHGAHLAWSFLSSLAEEGIPTAVRSAVIRLLPELCASNKRLFRRAKDVIGKSMVAQDPIIRLSATAALSDMANLDLLRDVEEIVGWIQNRLADDEDAIVYYALQTLRFLVVNEELEFDLVIRVLEKRFGIGLSNVNEVLNLGSLTLEGLVEFLGEGGLEEVEDDDDESNDDDGESGPEVSPQTVKAVSLLVELALSNEFPIEDDNRAKKDLPKARIKSIIYSSLARYSSQVLGLDAEAIRTWNGTDSPADVSDEMSSELQRFLCLKEIVSNGLTLAAQLSSGKSPLDTDEAGEIAADLLNSVAAIGKTLLLFEEDVHGSFLFRGGSSTEKSSKGKANGQTRVSKSVLSSLPAAQQIQDMHQSDPKSAMAVASLYSIGSSESYLQAEDILLQISECLGDIANEPLVEPALAMQQVCALMRSMSFVSKAIENVDESTREETLGQVFAQLEDWQDTIGEYAYVAAASLILTLDDSGCPGVAKVQNTILEGQDEYLFESDDTKLLCLGMVGAKLSRAADARVSGLIDSIEQSLSESSRQSSFGALFGLAIILSLLVSDNINGTDPSDVWRKAAAQRITVIFLSSLIACVQEENGIILELISSIENGELLDDLVQSSNDMESLYLKGDHSERVKAIMISLGHSFPALTAISNVLAKSVINVVNKLPWGSGKAFALRAGYKCSIDSGALDREDIAEAITSISSSVDVSRIGFGDALLSLASLCRLSPQKMNDELDLVSQTCQKVLVGTEPAGSDDKVLSILAACAAIGDFPGLGSLTPNIANAAKKNSVTQTVNMLEEVATNDAEEKCRDASTIGLGILCAMRTQSHTRSKTQKDKPNDVVSIQAKQGSVMQFFLKEIGTSHSTLCATTSVDDTERATTVKKLCTLFSALEPIAMPGNFSRVIELTLGEASSVEAKMKDSSISLLVSQLESRRRVGFDGRGFVDLSTRLAKMPSTELNTLVGPSATHILVTALPHLLPQVPTSAGEELAKSFWIISRADLSMASSSQSMTEFLLGLKTILSSANVEEKKHSISPALLRVLQKLIVEDIFSDLCVDAVPSNQFDTETVWAAYHECLELVPSAIVASSNGPEVAVSHSTVFGSAIRASLSSKSTRKAEYWIARQNMGDGPDANRRTLLLSTIVVAQQPRNDIEMKESVLSLFETMLVKGIDAMALWVVAAKCAFWFESRHVHQVAERRVSNVSSFFVARNLSFDVQSLPPALLYKMYESFVEDLPPKLATLADIWNISDEIANYATRICTAHSKATNAVSSQTHRDRVLSCLRGISQFISGGE